MSAILLDEILNNNTGINRCIIAIKGTNVYFLCPEGKGKTTHPLFTILVVQNKVIKIDFIYILASFILFDEALTENYFNHIKQQLYFIKIERN